MEGCHRTTLSHRTTCTKSCRYILHVMDGTPLVTSGGVITTCRSFVIKYHTFYVYPSLYSTCPCTYHSVISNRDINLTARRLLLLSVVRSSLEYGSEIRDCNKS